MGFFTILIVIVIVCIVCGLCGNSARGNNNSNNNYTESHDDIRIIDAKFREKGATCPKCNHEVLSSSKFCPNCGFNLNAVTSCPNCGAHVSAGSKFCANCGFKIN